MAKTKISASHDHLSHKEALIRLKRASGHLNKVISMTADDGKCVDILQQLSAVISALESCRVHLLQDHIKSCVGPLVNTESKKIISDLEVVIQRVLK